MEIKKNIFKNLKIIELTKYNKLKRDIKTLKEENISLKIYEEGLHRYYGSELGLNDKIQQEQKDHEIKIQNLNVEINSLTSKLEEEFDDYIELSEKCDKLKQKNMELYKQLNKFK